MAQKFIACPMRQCDEQNEPHVSHGGFRVEKCLQREGENDCRPPSDSGCADARTPGEDGQRSQGGGDCRWKSGREIVLSKNLVTGDLCPIGEGRFVETEVIVEIGNDIIAAFNHLARCFSKARFVAIDQRQIPCAGDVKENAADEQECILANTGIRRLLVIYRSCGVHTAHSK